MRGLFDFGFNRAVADALPRSRQLRNRDRLIACGLAIAGAIAVSNPRAASAQTCIAPLPWPMNTNSLAGNTCSGSQVAETLCAGQVANPGLNVVYRIYVDGNASEIDSTGFGMNSVMYLSDEIHTCDSSPCIASGGSISLAGLSPGYYRVTVAHSDLDAAGACGLFMLAADGDLSGSDVNFKNGFD
jgi:hypothetical protein